MMDATDVLDAEHYALTGTTADVFTEPVEELPQETPEQRKARLRATWGRGADAQRGLDLAMQSSRAVGS
jgi:hypothetical protein